MAKLVILKFNGDFQSGFQVDLEIAPEGAPRERGFAGSLPAAPELSRCLTLWRQQYIQLANNTRIKPQQIIYDGSILPQKQLANSAKRLQEQFQHWLNSPSFYAVDKHLREELHRQEAIRILICSDRSEIYQLPWCCWDILENYPNLEIAIGSFDFKRIPIPPQRHRHAKVRILAILGDDRGIDLNADRDFLQSLKDGDVVFLVEPTPQELYARLWEETWDIVFFAGHSKTIDRQGVLYLNREDRLTIEQLKHGFKRAIASGLQLAIFNSCDGLGLAEELGKLFLPQSIVMRMPIPDIMAQEFLKHFLQAYAGGSSLYLAAKIAREKLQSWENRYPCASWLPTIYQNPAVIPPQWKDLRRQKKLFPISPQLLAQQQPIPYAIIISAITLLLVWLIQSWGWLEYSELQSYDRLLTWRVPTSIDRRILVVTIDDRDIQYQRNRGTELNMRGSLGDEALNQLLTQLQTAQPKAIASDVIHDFPFEPDLAHTVAQMDNFFAICRVQYQPKSISIEPPSPIPSEQVGFSNWVIDDDGTIRRQLIGMTPDDICNTSQSLSLRLALKYLNPINIEYEPQGTLKIGQAELPKLKPTSGGYHLPDASGYQTLLDYRRSSPETIPLRDILAQSPESLKRLVNNKIVLIGVIDNQDVHYTPYSGRNQAKRDYGVIIHAQMTSNIISTALGEQKPLWWLCDRWEMLWIGIWSAVGSGIVILYRRTPLRLFISIVISLGLITVCSWLLLLNGGWLITIAPSLALFLSAGIAWIYFQNLK